MVKYGCGMLWLDLARWFMDGKLRCGIPRDLSDVVFPASRRIHALRIVRMDMASAQQGMGGFGPGRCPGQWQSMSDGLLKMIVIFHHFP